MKQHIFLIATVVTLACVSKAEVEQSVRFYTAGSLVNSSSIPTEGDGLLKVFVPKNRGFGTFELVTIIKTIASEMAQQFPKRDRLQIGDVANHKGGNIGQHKSHQNGLDADIVYYRRNNKEQNPALMGKYVEKFVSKGKITPNFDIERNWLALSKLASYPQVERVFVDMAIKRGLCNLYSKSSDPIAQQALRIMRPAALHDDHMHVRIGCPKSSSRCVSQPAPPPGNGCSPYQMRMDLEEAKLEEAQGC